MNISKEILHYVFISILTCIALNCKAVQQEISTIPLQNCNYEKVMHQSILSRAKNEVLISQNRLQHSKELEELAKKAPNNSKQPIGNYLNDSEKIRFTIASQKLESSNVSQLIESRYQRDLVLLAQMKSSVD